jgi:hypothetical protein
MKINAANHTWLFVFTVKTFDRKMDLILVLARSKIQSMMKNKFNTRTD